jgi:pyruvate formate lyase activating enzyme
MESGRRITDIRGRRKSYAAHAACNWSQNVKSESGFVFNIQKYSLHDGPGIRTTVFLKGCPLCCQWCHNPESISPKREIIVVESRCITCGECRQACEFGESVAGTGMLPPRHDQCTLCAECVDACPTGARQMIGRTMTVAEVLAEVLQDRIFYEDSKGGVTISGGEPLMQPHFTKELLVALREAGIHTTFDTTGFGCTEHLIEAARLADLVLYDLKAFSEQRHRELTGVTNRNILTNLTALNEVHRNIWIRLPFVLLSSQRRVVFGSGPARAVLPPPVPAQDPLPRGRTNSSWASAARRRSGADVSRTDLPQRRGPGDPQLAAEDHYAVDPEACIRIYREKIIPFWRGRSMRDCSSRSLPDEWKEAYAAGIFTEFMEQRAPATPCSTTRSIAGACSTSNATSPPRWPARFPERSAGPTTSRRR